MQKTSQYAAILSLSETGLGALLHAIKLPFAGTFLCLNQIFLLTKAAKEDSTEIYQPLLISSIAALLKSVAPIGKKVTPMIALSMQGALYSCGLFFLGNNRVGRLAAGILAISWSALQSLLFYYLIFGKPLIDMVIPVVLCLAALKIALALSAVFLAENLSALHFDHYFQKLLHTSPSQAKKASVHPVLGALRDLCKPLFLLSALATTFFAPGPLTLFRVFGLGFLCFYLARLLPADRLIAWLSTRKESPLNQLLQNTLQEMQIMQSLRQRPQGGSAPDSDGSRSVQT